MTGNRAEERRMRRRWRKTVYVIPSLVTTANIFCGFYSIMESLLGVQSLSVGDTAAATDHFNRAAINIGFAWLFDFLDGNIARLTNATSEFGIELDSIADVLSFGIAPALLAFSWGYGQVAGLHKLGWAASFIFVICGALRLARFNVQARNPNPNLPPKNPKDKKAFVGLPIPAAANLIGAIVHFSPTPVAYKRGFEVSAFGQRILIDGMEYSVALLTLMFFLSMLMVSTIRYSSLKNVGGANYHPRMLILAIALLVMLVWFYSQWALLAMAVLYSSHGVVGKLWSMLRPRRSDVEHTELEPGINPRA